jgi:putative ABC transport system substrate-binding protein
MKKAAILSILVAVAVLAVGVIAEAQQPKKVPRIGYLSSTDPATESIRAEGIRLALRERGYTDGQNIAIEYRYAEGKQDRAPEFLAELVRLKVDIIVVAGGNEWRSWRPRMRPRRFLLLWWVWVRSCRGRPN